MRLRLTVPTGILLTLFAAALLAAAACGGGGGDGNGNGGGGSGRLTDPGSAPTATPWPSAPPVRMLDPNAITPIGSEKPVTTPPPGDGGGVGDATPVPGVCGDTYVVIAGDYPGLIAEKCGVSVDDLLAANPGLDPTALQPGQEINVP